MNTKKRNRTILVGLVILALGLTALAMANSTGTTQEKKVVAGTQQFTITAATGTEDAVKVTFDVDRSQQDAMNTVATTLANGGYRIEADPDDGLVIAQWSGGGTCDLYKRQATIDIEALKTTQTRITIAVTAEATTLVKQTAAQEIGSKLRSAFAETPKLKLAGLYVKKQ